jgi:hypothetical protein
MQLSPDNGDMAAALDELRRVIPLAALQNVYAYRKKRHKKRKHVMRAMKILRAKELTA